jgi:acetylglutamate kinase
VAGDDVPDKAKVLTEVLPYIKMHRGKTVVIKFGGNAMESPEIRRMFASDVVLMRYVGINPVIVHGGGPQIAKMVLVGKVNKDIVSLINRHGALAMGLSGEDGNLVMARRRPAVSGADLGWVGEVESVNATILAELLSHELIPVIASVGTDAEGNSYNINADTAAGEVAMALAADKVIYMTNVKGIMSESGELISRLDASGCKRILESGGVSQGMIPKVTSCLRVVESGVESATVLDGTVEHALLLEVFTDEGVGTMITLDPQKGAGAGE